MAWGGEAEPGALGREMEPGWAALVPGGLGSFAGKRNLGLIQRQTDCSFD